MPGPAIITGGSSGIGLALASLLHARGHPLTLIARDDAKLAQAAAALGGAPLTLACDVADAAALEAAVQQAHAKHGAPDYVIASAGIAEPGHFTEQPLQSHQDQMATNYFGALHLAQAAVPHMASGGRLVFIGSGAGFFGIHGYAAYAPTKFALRGLAEVLRVELKPQGITVTLAYPPDTDTPQLAAEARTKPAATKEITASGGLWQPEAVAQAILKGADKGRFAVAPGVQMKALLWLHSLLGPALRRWQDGIVKKHPRP